MRKALFAGVLAVAAIGTLMAMPAASQAHPTIIVSGSYVRPVYPVYRAPVVVNYGYDPYYSSYYYAPTYPVIRTYDVAYPRIIVAPRVVTPVYSPYWCW